MKLKYKIGLVVIAIGLVVALFIAQSYALWFFNASQSGKTAMNVGCFEIAFSEGTTSINLTNTYPVSDSVGLGQTPYTFTITNTCSVSSNYTISLNTINTKTLDDSKIKFAIYENNEAKPTTGTNLGTYKTDHINTDTTDLGVTNLLQSIILTTGTLKQDAFKTYNLYLWIDESAGNEIMGQTFEASLNVQSRAVQLPPTISEDIIELAKTDTTTLASDEAGNNRYIGANPNNYVTFNGETAGWRIIGSFKDIDDGTEKKEWRTKIIKSDSLGNMAWDESSNDWNTADIKEELNGTYLNGLSAEAQGMIGTTKWAIGKSSAPQQTAATFYSQERSGATWTGKIGLMYPSDYGYAVGGGSRATCLNKNIYDYDASECKGNDWLFNSDYQWTLTTISSASSDAFIVGGTGFVTATHVDYPYGVRPVLYLSSDVTIVSGSGTSSDPFILSV